MFVLKSKYQKDIEEVYENSRQFHQANLELKKKLEEKEKAIADLTSAHKRELNKYKIFTELVCKTLEGKKSNILSKKEIENIIGNMPLEFSWAYLHGGFERESNPERTDK